LRDYATARLLAAEPIHRWFVFPHSYSADLVRTIVRFWGLTPRDSILDPFVGAGTTLLAAKENGIPATGLDLSPLAVLASQVKVAHYHADELIRLWNLLQRRLPSSAPPSAEPRHRILQRAFGEEAWDWWCFLRQRIRGMVPAPECHFFVLALLKAMRSVCRASSDGGWLRWTRRRPRPSLVPRFWQDAVETMLEDARSAPTGRNPDLSAVRQGDARFPPSDLGRFSALICSPPYPNRHDYTRVFAPELLLEFLDEEGVRALRYGSFRSQVEARAPSHAEDGYKPSRALQQQLAELKKAPVTDRRVVPMVDGYFRDSFQMLRALRTHLSRNARLAFVVGNVRHAGVMIEVDRALADLGESAGYRWDGTWIIRYRGNSAQQMASFGREASRESVVFFKPA
jgi:hypothetical protein